MKRWSDLAPRPAKPATLPQVASFECSCGTIHNSRDGNIPVGWTQSAGTIFCADCTRIGIPVREIRKMPRRRRAA